MATIELSPAFYSAAMPRIWRLDDITPSITNYSQSGILPTGGANDSGHVYSEIGLYSGASPTTWIGSPLTTYASARLVQWATGSQFSGSLGAVSVATTTIINTAYNTATASNTATWFLILCRNRASDTPYQQIIGSVGVQGSGADLELANTSIVSGRLYKISNLRITLPGSWTY